MRRTCWWCTPTPTSRPSPTWSRRRRPIRPSSTIRSPGAGTKSHLTGELLKLRADIEMVHVPYRGAGPAVQAVLEKTVSVGSIALAAAETLIQGGQLRALAVTSEKRWFSLPNVPTMIEAGYQDFVSDTFNAFFAPARVPQDDPRAAGEGKPRRLPAAGRARPRAQGRLRGGRRHAGGADGAHQGGDPGGARAGREGRHSAAVREGEGAS